MVILSHMQTMLVSSVYNRLPKDEKWIFITGEGEIKV